MWKIVTWSRAEGRGELESDHHGRLGFDAGVANVDDFIVGEDVWAEIDTGVHPLGTAPRRGVGLDLPIPGSLERLAGADETTMPAG